MSPTPVGYLFLGMVVFAVPELLSAGGTVHLLAELGVVFQLFDIGPHFSTAHVRHGAGDIFGFGSLQVSASTILIHSAIGPAEQLRQHGITVIVGRQAEEWLHRRELPWRTYVRRAVALPSLDYCR
jgi:hypothetical protein